MILNAHCKIKKITHSLATEAGQELGRVDTPQFSAFYFFELFALVGEKIVRAEHLKLQSCNLSGG